MNSTIIRSAIIGTTLLALSHVANATLLVGWYDFKGNNEPSSGSDLANENAVVYTSGYSGLLTKGGVYSVGNSGSTDKFYGNSPYFASNGNDGYARVLGTASNTIFSVTNNSGPVMQLDKLFLDAHNSNTFTIRYQISGTPGLPILLGSGTGNASSYKSMAFDLFALNVSLLQGQTISFIFNSPAGTRIDNIAISAIPEPASLLALGCVLGSGLLLRNRRRPAGPLPA